MLSLFSTHSDKAGFRLQHMEVYNWGTFHDRIFRISPQGNNSLLTGANASGKSTFIDALLTLLVPVKKIRFYNQSSGVDKKGDRTEETYVRGNYGNIQREGELSTTAQTLRDKSTHSILLASFANTDQKEVTIFQLRWFSNGELRRAFGLGHVGLHIEQDFSEFDAKGNWKKRLEKKYNAGGNKRKIEFFDGPTAYAERLAQLLGMRSTKALSLFNQVVGVKVLDDLDDFIRTNMLEEQDAEAAFRQLKESFLTLMDAKTNIEKAKEQIAQLEPVCAIAEELEAMLTELRQLAASKEMAAYWFTQKEAELAALELEKCLALLETIRQQLRELDDRKAAMEEDKADLKLQIKADETGNRIEQLKREIAQLEKSREERKNRLDKYNRYAAKVGLATDPGRETFEQNRERAAQLLGTLEQERQDNTRRATLLEQQQGDLSRKMAELEATAERLRKNKNNIAGREAEIRDDILAITGASREEIPFIGELIRVRESEQAWELSAEKILHHLALRLIVPEAFYTRVNDYVNTTHLRGRISYQRYRGFTPVGRQLRQPPAANALVHKLAFKPGSSYGDWLEELISTQYDYACVEDLAEFARYEKKAVTREGLMKLADGKHEKDDRPHVSRKENYVLGWDNKEKLRLLQQEHKQLKDQERQVEKDIRALEQRNRSIAASLEAIAEVQKRYAAYEDIDWQHCAVQIEDKERQRVELERTSNRVQVLQQQLRELESRLSALQNEHTQKQRELFSAEAREKEVSQKLQERRTQLQAMGVQDTTAFEQAHPDLLRVTYATIDAQQRSFWEELMQRQSGLEQHRRRREDEVRIKINKFKQPAEDITLKYKDWRADVSRLPDSTMLEFIGEYQRMYQQLVNDNLPRFEKKFNDYLQETITNKVGDFRMFFKNWEDSIKENIRLLNESLRGIDFRDKDFRTYIQLMAPWRINDEVKEFRNLLDKAMPEIRLMETSADARRYHFYNHIEPLIQRLDREDWRNRVMDVRAWYSYKAEEFYQETGGKYKTYEHMGQLSGGEKAQLTYTILGSAIAYQFGLTKEGLQTHSFRFIAIDEAFKAQDEDKARYLITLCRQLHLQLLVVTPSDNIHIVEHDISYVHFVERKEEKYSWLYDMPIEQFREEKANYLSQ